MNGIVSLPHYLYIVMPILTLEHFNSKVSMVYGIIYPYNEHYFWDFVQFFDCTQIFYWHGCQKLLFATIVDGEYASTFHSQLVPFPENILEVQFTMEILQSINNFSTRHSIVNESLLFVRAEFLA